MHLLGRDTGCDELVAVGGGEIQEGSIVPAGAEPARQRLVGMPLLLEGREHLRTHFSTTITQTRPDCYDKIPRF